MWVFFSSGLSDMGKVVPEKRVSLSAKLTLLPAPTALAHAPIVSSWPNWPRWVPLQSNRVARLAEPTVQYRKWSPTANDPQTENDLQNGWLVLSSQLSQRTNVETIAMQATCKSDAFTSNQLATGNLEI